MISRSLPSRKPDAAAAQPDGAGSENGASSASSDEEVVDAEVVDEQK